ncbi:hypothetical protein EMIT0232MI5_30090 [Pseudomonas sp. IT-232MI5]
MLGFLPEDEHGSRCAKPEIKHVSTVMHGMNDTNNELKHLIAPLAFFVQCPIDDITNHEELPLAVAVPRYFNHKPAIWTQVRSRGMNSCLLM